MIDDTGDRALRTLTRPDGGVYSFDYATGTMLTRMVDPKGSVDGGAFTFHYTDGLLDQDTDARPGSTPQTLSRLDSSTGSAVTRVSSTVTHTSPGQKITTYKTERVGNLQTRTITNPDLIPIVEQARTDFAPEFTVNSKPYDTLLTRADGTKFYSSHTIDPVLGTSHTSAELTELPSQLRRLDERLIETSLDPTTGVITSQKVTTTRNGNTTNPTVVLYTGGTTRTVKTTSPAGRTSTLTLDAQGRPSLVNRSGIAQDIAFTYDAAGRLSEVNRTPSMSRSTQFAYFSTPAAKAGYLSSVTEGPSATPLRVTAFDRDALGQAVSQTVAGEITSLGWDANGNLTGVTPPSKPAHSLLYTPINQLKSYAAPPLQPGSPTTTGYTYNADRQIQTETRPDGTVLTWSYDTAGRRDTLTIPAGTLLDYDYYPASPMPAGAAPGRVQTIKARTGTAGVNLGFQYDGELTTLLTWSGAVAGTVGWTYNTDFNPSSETAQGKEIKFGYDLDRLMTCASATGCSPTPAADALVIGRDQSGLVTSIALGSVTETLTYNGFGELGSQALFFGSTQLMAIVYDDGATRLRDALGRIATNKGEKFGTAATKNFYYTYDGAGRLTDVCSNATCSSRLERYSYDANGNRKSYSLTSTTQQVFTDDQDRLINYGGTAANTTSGGVIYNYTANGEVSSEVLGSSTWTFTYDLLGNLVSTRAPGGQLIGYLVDGQNRRVGKTRTDNSVPPITSLVKQWLYHDSLNPVAELDGSGALVARFVYATRSNIPDFIIRGTDTYRLFSDHLGSPRLAVNVATGEIVYRADYDAFGQQTMRAGSADWIPFGFAGGLIDPEPGTGLVRFGARDYEPKTGRWMQRDPIRFDGGDSNLYSYVLNDPINRVDPAGTQIDSKRCIEDCEKGCYDKFNEALRRCEAEVCY